MNAPKNKEKTKEENPPFGDLKAIPATSLLGNHNGVMDDDLFELLNEGKPRSESD